MALTVSLTLLLLPGEYYQNTSSHCKQKKNHTDGWSEDVLNHVQAARKERVYVVTLLRMNQHGAGLQEAAVGDTGSSCASQACPGRKNSRHGIVRLPAGHGAEQTRNCRSKLTLESESHYVFSDLRMGSCICSGLTPLFVNLVCNG